MECNSFSSRSRKSGFCCLFAYQMSSAGRLSSLGHCYYFLCSSLPARVAFSENTKKKTFFEIDQAAAHPSPATLASACKLHDTTDWKPQSPTSIKAEPLSGGGIDDENSEGELFKLQSSWRLSIKIEKDGLRNPLVCVGTFQALDIHVNARSTTEVGPIDDRSDFAPFAASSANMTKSMEVELTIKWSRRQGFFFAAVFFGNCHGWRPCRGERLGEDAGKDTSLQSNEYFCDAVCGNIARKTSSPKGHRRLPWTGKLLKGLEAAQFLLNFN